MENGNSSAVTHSVDAAQTWVKLDHVGSPGQFEKRDRCVLVEIENGHQFVSLAREKTMTSITNPIKAAARIMKIKDRFGWLQ